ncbi:unnamed protein product [Sphagnum troendelagicum]|uniref:Uncharacterized protein n=1 Tax=Sphagnum troendelagicum TaxID=128251 RepID=A0ABP0U9Y8_9BRYO
MNAPPAPVARSSGIATRTVAMAGPLAHSHHNAQENVLLVAKSRSDSRGSAHPLHELLPTGARHCCHHQAAGSK